jgi:hypothetical protein
MAGQHGRHLGEGPPFTATDWVKLLYLASLYGYDPTMAHPDEPISELELAHIAFAVREALPDIPDHDATGNKAASQMSPFEWYSGARKDMLLDFVDFCTETLLLED